MRETMGSEIRGFLLGLAAALGLLLLTGAVGNDSREPLRVINDPDLREVALLRNGRYQIAAMPLEGRGGVGCGLFIVDTSTGVTKPVYGLLAGEKGKRRRIDNLGKPFSRIR